MKYEMWDNTVFFLILQLSLKAGFLQLLRQDLFYCMYRNSSDCVWLSKLDLGESNDWTWRSPHIVISFS